MFSASLSQTKHMVEIRSILLLFLSLPGTCSLSSTCVKPLPILVTPNVYAVIGIAKFLQPSRNRTSKRFAPHYDNGSPVEPYHDCLVKRVIWSV